MTLLVCYRGGESTAVYFPILLRYTDLSSPTLLSDFSGAGSDIQEQRSPLKPSKVDDVLLLPSNLKHHAKHKIV